MAHRSQWNRSGQMNSYGSGGYGLGINQNSSGFGAYQLGALQAQQMYVGGQESSGNKQQRVIYGSVTKLFDNFGYVDDEIFFMKSIIRGPMVRVGDRVSVEAIYQPNMPVKWNAERIQLADPPSHSSSSAAYGRGGGNVEHYSGGAYGSESRRHGGSSSARRAYHDSSSGRDSRDYTKDHHNNSSVNSTRASNERDSLKRPRPGSLVGSSSTAAVNYFVKIPHRLLTLEEASVVDLRQRYPQLYIPSDFFHSNLCWQRSFTVQHPMTIGNHCEFHVTHREVPPLISRSAIEETEDVCVSSVTSLGTATGTNLSEAVQQRLLEPVDADYRYSAKVMLMSQPALSEIYSTACRLAEDKEQSTATAAGNKSKRQHLTRLMQFVVGVKGKNEPMALGGPWSPSLDGNDPEGDPQVLVNTAVRTVRALTGLDLSNCSQWYKLLELHYHRSERPDKSRPARLETVAVFLPDVWTCMPSENEWNLVKDTFKERLDVLLAPPVVSQVELDPASPAAPEVSIDEVAVDDIEVTESIEADAVIEDLPAAEETTDYVQEAAEEKMEACVVVHEEDDSIAEESTENEVSGEPTHHSELDVKTLKVADLRKELETRGLSSKGLKAQLTARLQKAIDDEEESERKRNETAQAAARQEGKQEITATASNSDSIQDDAKSIDVKIEPITLDMSDKKPVAIKELSDQDKRRLKRMYALPDHSAILIHPNPAAKGGKFDCHRMSLASLLDYRQDDTREHTFEVSLFAEQMNEMLTRDFVFLIYRALVAAPEKEEASSAQKQIKDDVTAPRDEPDAKKVKATNENKEDIAEELDASEDKLQESTTSDNKDEDNDAAKQLIVPPRKVHRTVDPRLLLAFTYIDINQIGYLQDRDLEELLQTLGLLLSRAQVRKLVQKVVTKRDMVQYRSLTDRDVVEGETGDITVVRSLLLEEDDDEMERIEELLIGNKTLLGRITRLSERSRSGAVVNAEALVLRAEKLEAARCALQVQFDMCCAELNSLREKLGRADASETRLYKETQDLRDKLRAQRKSEDLLRQNATIYQKLLRNSKNQLESVLKEITLQFDKERREKERREERERERHDKERAEKEEASASKSTKDSSESSAVGGASQDKANPAVDETCETDDADHSKTKSALSIADSNGKDVCTGDDDDEDMMAMMEGEGFEVLDTV